MSKDRHQALIEMLNEEFIKGTMRLPPIVPFPKFERTKRDDYIDSIRYCYGLPIDAPSPTYGIYSTGYDIRPPTIHSFPKAMRWISTLCAIAGLAEDSAASKASPYKPWEFEPSYCEEGPL